MVIHICPHIGNRSRTLVQLLLIIFIVTLSLTPLSAQTINNRYAIKYFNPKTFPSNSSKLFHQSHQSIDLRTTKAIQRLLHPLITDDKTYLPPNFNKQGVNDTQSPINWTIFTITSGVIAGIYTSFFIYEQTRRWSSPKRPFYFRSQVEGKGIDKLGHFYETKFQASTISDLYKFSNISNKTATWLGTGIAFAVQTLIEIKDGTITGGGFDIYDQTADLLGAGWFYARENSSFLKRFNIRWFYYPSPNSERLPQNAQFNEDYNGQMYWISMQIWDLLPKNIQPYWPRFIVPAAGITLNSYSLQRPHSGYFSYHLSLSIDFRYLFSHNSTFWQSLADFLNNFYIPAPAVEVYPDFGFKLIFYGQD